MSRCIVDFSPPPLIIRKSHYYGDNGEKSDILLSFYDYFVNFNYHSLIQFASNHYKHCKFTKTCFIQLFDEKEAKLLTSKHGNNTNEIKEIYGFLTRLYSSVFEKSHHIHLFAKHHRSDIDNFNLMRFGKHENEIKIDNKLNNKKKCHLLIKMKSINIYGNNIKNYHLTSFTPSIKILLNLLSTIIYKECKISPMTMYDLNGSLTLISKIKLRLNVVEEIRSIYDPLYLQSNQNMVDLCHHILRSKQKYQSNSMLRVSYN